MNIFQELFSKDVALRQGNIKPIVLLILDGWGIAPDSEGNAISRAKKPNMDKLYGLYPHGELIASGESVGLPANEVGNTEVGHLNMGAGRVILQDLKRISKSIEDTSFFDNKAFRLAAEHIAKYNSSLHIMGLVSSGNVHSSLSHFYSLIEFCKQKGIKRVFYHLFTDGRDAAPNEGIAIIKKIEEEIKSQGIGSIASVSGRFYAMDRDRRWERIQKTYNALVNGQGKMAGSAVEAIQNSYTAGATDEFIEPTIVNREGLVKDNDAVIFFNFRIDRPRELTMAFTIKDFATSNVSWEFDPYAVKYAKKHEGSEVQIEKKEPFVRGKVLNNLFFVTMTQYQKNLPVSAVAFPPEAVVNSLPAMIGQAGMRQMHMAESEKERFVTYYFDGLREEKLMLEDTLIVPSPKVATYDKKPEMSVFELTREVKKTLARDFYHFIVVNFANPDMVAHSGNLPATIKAIEYVDKAVGELLEAVNIVGGTLIITADHGNAEELINYPTASFYYTSNKGTLNTDHSNFPVPVIFAGKTFEGKNVILKRGILGDIAPTILNIMGIAVPKEMTGRNLLA